MEPKIKMGISAVQNGLRAVSLGRKALAFRKFLPGGRRKAAGRAMQKAEKQVVQANTKTLRKKDRRKALQRIKGIGRVALVVRRKYF